MPLLLLCLGELVMYMLLQAPAGMELEMLLASSVEEKHDDAARGEGRAKGWVGEEKDSTRPEEEMRGMRQGTTGVT